MRKAAERIDVVDVQSSFRDPIGRSPRQLCYAAILKRHGQRRRMHSPSVTAMRTIDGDLCQRIVPLFAYLARWTMNIACWGKAQILNAKVPYILQTGFQIAVGSTVSDIAGNTKYFVSHNTYARCYSACKTHSIIRNRSAL